LQKAEEDGEDLLSVVFGLFVLVASCIRTATNAGVLRLRLRMTAKNKQQHKT